MSCPNANAPIDISLKSISGKCDLKCNYNFRYPNSSCIVTNREDYLSISYDSFSSAPVQYNTVSYNVKEIRLYNPSVHTFDGKKSVGEIIIIHVSNTGNKPLLVCIPITENNTQTNSSTILTTIIDNTALHAPSDGESTTITLDNFTLDDFVPKKPFFSYTAIQPYQPCVGDVDILIFGPRIAECYITGASLEKLQSINSANNYTTKTGPLLFLNSKGPGQTGTSDEIFIDCKPINKSQEQITISTPNPNSSSTTYEINWDDIKNSAVFQIIMGSLLFVFIIILFNMLLKLLSGGSIELPKFNKIRKES